MAVTMRRLRPKRLAASLPATLAAVTVEPEAGCDHGRRKNRSWARVGARRDVGKERHAPTAQGTHLERVHAVADRVSHGRAISQHRPEIVKSLSLAGAPRLLCAGTISATHSHATEERGLPAGRGRDEDCFRTTM